MDPAKIEADLMELKADVAELAPKIKGLVSLVEKAGPVVAEILAVVRALKPL